MRARADRRPIEVPEAVATFRGVRAHRAVDWVDLRAEPERVAAGGFWVVVGDFEGPVQAWRFADVVRDPLRERDVPGSLHRMGPEVGDGGGPEVGVLPDQVTARPTPWHGSSWHGPRTDQWQSSMDEATYRRAVDEVRERIRAGDVYQANICRLLTAPLPAAAGQEPSAVGLGQVLAARHSAPFASVVHIPHPAPADRDPARDRIPGAWVVSASPELFLRVGDGAITSAPIKGTAVDAAGLREKDRAENVMITDLVRNDLQRVCAAGTVEVTHLLEVQSHPGLVHLVSTVTGALSPDVLGSAHMWRLVLDAAYPPGSVSGAPKAAALKVIAELERTPRGPYCGTVGWIDADGGRAELAVGIRTFVWTPDDGGRLTFGTGAGITWGSDPAAEWSETELKAGRLIRLASTAE